MGDTSKVWGKKYKEAEPSPYNRKHLSTEGQFGTGRPALSGPKLWVHTLAKPKIETVATVDLVRTKQKL